VDYTVNHPVIELRGVSKTYGPTIALDSTNLRIPTARTTVLIGPSGCGKSTLLRLVVGLVRPDSGEISFLGDHVTPETVAELRRRMGYVIQEGGLFPHLTCRANVTLMARFLGWDAQRTDDRLQELADLAQLPVDALARYPVQLSGGQRQRVALMRALMLDPEVLLLDEPLGALDPMIRSGLQEDLRQVFQTLGKTVVMVTHDMGEAAFFGDTIVLMREGSVVQQGALRELVGEPSEPFVTRFINAQRSPLSDLTRPPA
jgi:osmoprotectant transport system ATP-binding protein